jgi:molybdate transport system substrate-binding protein
MVPYLRWLALSALIACGLAAPGLGQEPVTIFAAASLKNALENAAKAFTAEAGVPVRFSFAASSALARQIEQGAPADLFASADLKWMDYLAERKLIRAETRVDLLSNRLVVVAPRDSGLDAIAFTPESFRQVLGRDGRIATGEINSVPAGRYAKAAFETLGLWREIRPRLAQAENVRAALAFVARGEAPLGVVYETDARAEPKVKIVAAFPADSHPPVVYPFAVVAGSKNEGAARFLAYLRSPATRPFFEAQGFAVIGSGADGS